MKNLTISLLCLVSLFTNGQYILTDDDVFVTNGVIESCSYDFTTKDIIVPATLDRQNVTDIGNNSYYLFKSKGNTSVQLPSILESIGSEAFYPGFDEYSDDNDNTYSPGEALTDYALNYYGNIEETQTTTEVTAGNLINLFTPEQLATITSLTLTGTIDARDFKTMRDEMPLLAEIDISEVNILAYTGIEGTFSSTNTEYASNTIPGRAFFSTIAGMGKTNLNTVKLPNSVNSIGNAAFLACYALSSVNLPGFLTLIGVQSFSNCGNLDTIFIPSSVTSIGFIAFSGSTAYINVDENNSNYASLDGVLFNKAKTTLIQCPISKTGVYNIPSTITTIGNNSFTNCSGLTLITIPSSVITIEGSAFSACTGLTTLKIPSSVTSIQGYAFQICRDLTSLFVDKTTPLDLSSSQNVFINMNTTNCTLYVPFGSKVAYQVANQWQNFENIVEIDFKKTFNVTAGNLSTILNQEQLDTLTSLTLIGTIDARDFKTMRDNMPLLEDIDLSGVTIVAYTGAEGTSVVGNTSYPSNTIPEYAYLNESWQGKNSLISIVLPESINAIGIGSFTNCNGLTSIEIPSSVTQIGNSAFATCNGLTTVSIPSSVTSIEDGAFTGCPGLINVDNENANYSSIDGILFNKTQTELIQFPTSKSGDYAIPSTVINIGSFSFFSSSLLTSITIPNSVISIKRAAFAGCRSLTSVIIPSSVTTLERYAFQHCSGLISVIIPSSVISIGGDIFQGCTSLNTIYNYSPNPVDLSSVSNVFSGVNKSTCTLYVPYGAASLYSIANQWQDFENIVEMPGFSLSSTTETLEATGGSVTTVSISSDITWTATSDQIWLTVDPATGSGNQQTVTFTATEANPSSIPRIATVTISADGVESQTITVTQAGAPLAVTAGNLINLFTPEQLATITKLTLIGTIDARDFKTMRDEMPLLAEIDLSGVDIIAYTGPEGTSLWGNNIYSSNAIPEYAFSNFYQGKTNLRTIILPFSATSIMEGAFGSCNDLKTVIFQSGLTSIGYGAFHKCIGLTSINLLEGLTTIGDAAFHRCTNLATIQIPSTVSYIGGLSLGYSSYIIVDDTNSNYVSVDGVLFNKNKTAILQYYNSNAENYSIPSSVTSIGSYAFYLCNSLTSITIPTSVTSIGFESFAYCYGLTSVSIPSSVKIIEHQAFNFCNKLNSIYTHSITPIDLSNSTGVFANVNKVTCTLFVPYGTKEAYQAANQWQDFENIVEFGYQMVVFPSESGVILNNGQIYTITWQDFTDPYVKIELMKGGTLVRTITSARTNSGSMNWRVTENLVPGNDYKIRITSTATPTMTAESANSFTIEPLSNPMVNYPSASDVVWNPGTIYEITWKDFTDPYVRIELLKGGIVVRTIASSRANSGSMNWNVAALPQGNDYKIRITSTATPAMTDVSDNNFTIQPLSNPVVTYPSATDIVWNPGTIYEITWQDFTDPYVRIELLKGGELVRTIATARTNTGSMNWRIANLPAGNDYKIRITSTATPAMTDISDNFFVIQPAASPMVTYPSVAGIVWVPGTIYEITWENYTDPYVRIELLKGGSLVRTVASVRTNSGSMLWRAPALESGNDYRIRVTSTTTPAMTDESDNNFRLSGPPMVTYPSAAGIVWEPGTIYEITWQDFTDPYVKIELLKGGSVVRTVTTSTPNDGTMLWRAPAITPGNDYKIQITSTATPAMTDLSDNNFSISGAKSATIAGNDPGWNDLMIYPNPFTDRVTIGYSIAEKGRTLVEIFDLTGRRVTILQNAIQEAGTYELQWDATDATGQQVISGIYLCRIQSGGFVKTEKMVLSK